ncbi:MAG: MFS transporter [Novosphingobium sp.]
MTGSSTIGRDHDPAYEFKAVMLLALGFGLVGVDRWVIAPLAPAIMQDLGIAPQQMNNLIAILGITWGLASVTMGNLADRLGRRRVLIPAILIFSLASGLSGLASGFTSLLIIRAAMGGAEGAFCPASFAATADAARPDRIGFAQGFQQSMFALFGLGFGPIIATFLLESYGWRSAFLLVAVPGLVIGLGLWLVIREPVSERKATPGESAPAGGLGVALREVIAQHNVRVGMLALMCAMCGIFVLSANVPIYLSEYMKLSPINMGLVTSAIGFGGFLGLWTLPSLSDIVGRRTMGIIGFLGSAGSLWCFIQTGAEMGYLFASLFSSSAFAFGLFSLLTGPIAAEGAPSGMISTTAGLIGGVGEILGGGMALVIAGAMIASFGIASMLYLALGGFALGAVVMLFLHETAPRVIARRGSK